MKHFLVVLTTFGVILCAAPAVSAQDKTDQGSKTVTGCLVQGESDNEYKISDGNGKTYGLMGSAVNLKPHVGHQVAITGTLDDKAVDGHASSEKDVQSLQVSGLKMISTTCK